MRHLLASIVTRSAPFHGWIWSLPLLLSCFWSGCSAFPIRARANAVALPSVPGTSKSWGKPRNRYAHDHENGLPTAGINLGSIRVSWDTELFPYLNPNSPNAMQGYSDKAQLLVTVQPRFFCPSDPIRRKSPRSYAMAARDMTYGWPPRSDDETGIGILWNERTVGLLGADRTNENPESLPELKLSVLPDPGHTLLLTELIQSNNTMGSLSDGIPPTGVNQPDTQEMDKPVPHYASSIRVWGADQQRTVFLAAPSFQNRNFNYLMADGHVELLSSLQAGAPGNDIWTIKAGD